MTTPLLQTRGLRVNYGPVEAVRGIDIDVHEGELVALLGANGAGKSSTLMALSGMLEKVEGERLWQGQSISGLSAEAVFALGLVQVPEGRGVFQTLTIADNLAIALDSRHVRGPLRRRALDEVAELFPVLAERGAQLAGNLSGGEQQMLALARALLCRPRLLMLDEPSMGLAPLVVTQIFDLLARIHAEGTSLLVVEQNAYHALAIADRAYVMEGGRITLAGTADKLREDPRVVSAYLGG